MSDKQISNRNITISWLLFKKHKYDLKLLDIHTLIQEKIIIIKNIEGIKLYERRNKCNKRQKTMGSNR